MMQLRSLLSLTVLFLLVGQWLYAQTGASQAIPEGSLRSAILPLRIIDKEILRGMAANNLAEALRFELNVEVEQAPEIGGARLRAADLNSRYTKVLLDGMPVSGSDMFGGHVDISSIPLNRVERVEISYAPLGMEYGSGTLAMVVNVVTLPDFDTTPTGTSAYASVYEQTVAGEYNLKADYGAKGRHVQQLGVQHYSANGFFFGVDLQRDAFKGVWGDYSGNLYQPDYTNSRGYAWSPTTTLNADAFVGYRQDKWSLLYRYGIADTEVPVYGHINNQEYVDGDFQDLYTVTDQENRYRRQLHHAQLKGKLWRDAALTIDLSYQDADTRKRSKWVRTADNATLNDAPLIKLYGARTWYSKGTLDKPIVSDRLDWTIGYEADQTKGFFSSEGATYISEDINRSVFSYAGFTSLQWRPLDVLRLRPGVRFSGTGETDPGWTYSLLMDYKINPRNNLYASIEKVYRYPNHRELFTYLETDDNLLEGNTDLKPEKGMSYGLGWQYHLLNRDSENLWLHLSGYFKELSDRIILVAAPYQKPGQDAYTYDNVNRMRSVTSRLDMKGTIAGLNGNVGFSVNGTKGNDIGDMDQFDKFVFHTEANMGLSYTFFRDYWIRSDYRYVSKLPFYSLERRSDSSPEVFSVLNRAPAYHLADLNIGTTFFGQKLSVATGVKNLFNYNLLEFEATEDGEHYRGDLRTIHIGYGRSFILRVGYQFN